MIPEIGQYAMILALLLAVAQAFFGIAGPWKGQQRWIAAVYPAVAGQFVLLALAFGCLIWSFVHNDFSVRMVAGHSNSALPVYYRVAAAWGNHDLGGRSTATKLASPSRWYTFLAGPARLVVLDANQPGNPQQLTFLRRVLAAAQRSLETGCRESVGG